MLAHNNTTYLSDGFIKASPANRRAVLETVAALEQQGHECVEFEIPQRKLVDTTVPNPLHVNPIIPTQRRVRWSFSLLSHLLMVIRN